RRPLDQRWHLPRRPRRAGTCLADLRRPTGGVRDHARHAPHRRASRQTGYGGQGRVLTGVEPPSLRPRIPSRHPPRGAELGDRMRRHLLSIAVLAAGVLAVAGCGSSNKSKSSSAASTAAQTAPSGGAATGAVKLSETEFKITPAGPAAKNGAVTIQATNDGT